MDFDYHSKDLDELAAYIDKAIASAHNENGNNNADLDILISIAEIAKKYALSAKNGVVSGSAFLKELIELSSPNYIYIPPIDSRNITMIPLYPSHSSQSQKISLKNSEGKPIILGKCLGQGGEGSVYKIPALPGKVAKVYHKRYLESSNCQNVEKKIRYLLKKKDAAFIEDTLVAALPEEIIYYHDGSFAGYIMPQFASTTKLFEVQREGHRRKLFPDLDYRGLIVIAYNLAEAVNHLHKHGIVVGDMNQNNILVHPDGTIGLIDCDSFDVTDSDTGEHFPCCVGLAELLAPELQVVRTLRNASFTKKSDSFSLAIHIFRLLMDNADPFGFSLTGDARTTSVSIVDSGNHIVNGECVYLRDVPGKQIPKWSPTLAILPEDIQILFRRTFGYTASTAAASVSKRPTASEWMDALQRFYQMPLTRCSKDEFHLYMPTLAECPFCLKQNNAD